MKLQKDILDLSKIDKREQKMVSGILEIKEKTLDKIMIPKNEVVAFSYNTTLARVLSTYKKYHYSRYPVYFKNLDQVVGILYIKDIILFWKEFESYPVVEFVRLPHFVYEDRPALDVFLELQKMRLSFAVAIDEFGGVSGIITLEDIIEEIVGEIEDEFDRKKKPYIERISSNEYIINTRMELDDFAERLNIVINENDVSTIGGLIQKCADRIPKVGEEVTYKNLKFKVLEATRRKINKVRLTIKPKS